MLKKNSLRVDKYNGIGTLMKFICFRELYKFSRTSRDKQDSLLFKGNIEDEKKIYHKRYWM